MAKKLEIYKCMACGNIVEVLHGGDGELVCCGQPMKNLIAKTADEGKEKHVPVIEKVDGGIKAKVGSVPHPMEEKHYIEWIEILADGKAYRQFLNSGDVPEAEFGVEASAVTAREHCSIHGLWKGE
jgi:superoxide reductase